MARFLMRFAIGLVLLGFSFSVHSESYPAAYFQPKLIYSADSNESDQQAQTTEVSANQGEFDPRYPAANFRPIVIFSSTEFIPSN
ncbi:hypothetical protein HC024_17515 [Methylococcaceae bacterium WWC4]|nr:hypothetical protein [Methylococcaceae bacterium WWC4]